MFAPRQPIHQTTDRKVRDEGDDDGHDQRFQREKPADYRQLTDGIQSEGEHEDFADGSPRRQELGPTFRGVFRSAPRRNDRPSRAKRKPSRMPKKIAMAGCKRKRRAMGRSTRSTRFSNNLGRRSSIPDPEDILVAMRLQHLLQHLIDREACGLHARWKILEGR